MSRPKPAGGTSRTRKLSPDELDDAQRALYAAILGGPRAQQADSVPIVDGEGRLEGPFNAFLLQPSVGQPLQALGAALRYATSLPDRAREIAILVVAAHEDAAFERHAHEPIARALGLTSAQLDGIRSGDHEALPPDEALIARAAGRLARGEDLDDALFTEVRDLLGEAQLFELTTLIGYYALLASQLRVFRVPVS